MSTTRKDIDDRRPGHVAVVDDDTGQIMRWEPKGERENPVFEAENPSELVTQENPSDSTSHNNDHSSMERENAVTDVANEFLQKAKPAGAIVIGNALGAELFDYIVRGPLSMQGSTVKKTVRIFGPGVLGVLVSRMSDNDLVRGVGLGHITESVRAGVEEALSFISNGKMGSEADQPKEGAQGPRQLSAHTAVDGNGELSGSFSSEGKDGQVKPAGSQQVEVM